MCGARYYWYQILTFLYQGSQDWRAKAKFSPRIAKERTSVARQKLIDGNCAIQDVLTSRALFIIFFTYITFLLSVHKICDNTKGYCHCQRSKNFYFVLCAACIVDITIWIAFCEQPRDLSYPSTLVRNLHLYDLSEITACAVQHRYEIRLREKLFLTIAGTNYWSYRKYLFDH